MGLYNFQEEDAYRFYQSQGIETKVRGRELQGKICPFCRSTKDKYSFSINLDNGCYKCLRGTCNAHGFIWELTKEFPNFHLSTMYEEYTQPKRKYKEYQTPKEPIVPKSMAVSYMQSRGISERITNLYEIAENPKAENTIAFLFFDEKGKLKYIKYRKTDFDKTKDKNKEWCDAGGEPILFGMKQCNLDNPVIVVTEGQIDSMSVAEAGIENAVSVPTGKNGTTWIPHCWNFMKHFKTIIVFGDKEGDEMTLLSDISKVFDCEVKHVRLEDYRDCKDANEILMKYGKDYLKSCVENAISVPIKKIVSLASVKPVDIFKIPKLQTGIVEEDRLLYGGLPFGYVHIIAGKRGDGKSTFASQIIANAIKQDYTTMVYSGELTNGNFKAWLDFQIAGRKNIIENEGQFGTPYWFITNKVQEKINVWYDEKCYLYDSNSMDDENESLVKTVEDCVKQYGAKVVLIDNLMTAIELNNDDSTNENDRQFHFVNNLAKIAMKYEALILLVAHRKKETGFKTDRNDDVLGSSKITNLAGVVINYDRPSEKQMEELSITENDRLLTTTKNRLFGRINYKGIVLNYDERSKRIYGTKDNVDVLYGWEGDDEAFGDNPFATIV